MKCIIGLGNPGRTYERTRHNVGFMAIDELAKEWSIEVKQEKFKGLYGVGVVNGEKVALFKPLTYMNLSGEAVRPFLDFYKIEIDDLVVIYDDLDLPTGKLRLRQKGSAGGHNGIKSLIQHLGTGEFNRIRIGISRPLTPMPIPDYVLGKFTEEEHIKIQEALSQTTHACYDWLKQPFIETMNRYN